MLTEVKIQRGILQVDALSPLIFIIAMMLLSNIFRKFTRGYKFTKSREKIIHLMFIGDIKLFAKNWRLIQARIYNQDIGIEFDIEKCAMLIIKNGNL